VLRDRGQLSEAAALFRQSLAVHRKVFGEEQASVARVISNLGMVIEDMGDVAGAESLFRESLAIRQKVLDPQHPDIGKAPTSWPTSGGNRASTRRRQRRREAIEIVRPALGNENPVTGGGTPISPASIWRKGEPRLPSLWFTARSKSAGRSCTRVIGKPRQPRACSALS
jgi:hypothetical protein